MAQTALREFAVQPEINPHVGQLTNRLMLSMMGQNGGFKDDEWRAITEVLSYAADAEQELITQRQRISQLEALSMTDDLTGLGNRRALNEFMKRTLAAVRRYREAGLLVFIDLDNFKRINDSLGHDAGDTVLREVAALLSAHTRSSDMVARYGGDEFVVVLVRCRPGEGKIQATRIETMLNSLVVRYANVEISIKASVGVEPFGPRSDFDRVLHRADHRMLANKRDRPR